MAETSSMDFEASLERIRAIVTELERGDLTLEESILRYREGAELLDGARNLIADAELRIRVLTEAEATDEADL